MSAALIAVQTQIQEASQNPESQSECTNFSSMEKSVFEAWRGVCPSYRTFRNELTSIGSYEPHVDLHPMVAAYSNGWLSDDAWELFIDMLLAISTNSVDGESDAETSTMASSCDDMPELVEDVWR